MGKKIQYGGGGSCASPSIPSCCLPLHWFPPTALGGQPPTTKTWSQFRPAAVVLGGGLTRTSRSLALHFPVLTQCYLAICLYAPFRHTGTIFFCSVVARSRGQCFIATRPHTSRSGELLNKNIPFFSSGFMAQLALFHPLASGRHRFGQRVR